MAAPSSKGAADATTSPEDARILARHVGPYLTQADLCHLDRYQVACRLVVDGRDTTGFTLATVPAPAIGVDHSAALRAAARLRGRDAEARRAERLARRWSPDADDDETDRSVCVPVSVPVSPPVSVPVSETGTETGTPDGASCQRESGFPEIR